MRKNRTFKKLNVANTYYEKILFLLNDLLLISGFILSIKRIFSFLTFIYLIRLACIVQSTYLATRRVCR